jgi:hypothetical protein
MHREERSHMGDKLLESQLYELITKNQRKFSEIIDKTISAFKEKHNKEIFIRNREKVKILDGTNSQDHFSSLLIVEDWIDKCIDDIRNYIRPFSYPIFVYLYLDLILRDWWAEGIYTLYLFLI